MWNNYFFQIQKKYNMRISTKLPLVVRFDGRQITKNYNVNLLDNYSGSFFDSLEKTAKYFSEKYHCFSIFGSDEISFIIPEPLLVVEDLEPKDKTTHSQELIALFSQYFFDYFNHFDVNQKIFWHGKCCSIPKEKVKSYIKYRSGIIKNVMVTYFLKKNNIKSNSSKLEEKLNECKVSPSYNELEEIKDGVLYYDGMKIELNTFLESDAIKEVQNKTDRYNDNIYREFEDIDVEVLGE